MTKYYTKELKRFKSNKVNHPVFLNDKTMELRLNKVIELMEIQEIDVLVIYSDIEHGNNFEYLTGFLTRFEEGLLVLHRNRDSYLLLGNENLKMVNHCRIKSSLVHVPFFSLPNQPMDNDKKMEDYFVEAKITGEMKVGIVGWKKFSSKNYDNTKLFDMPYYIVESLNNIVNQSLFNAIDIFIGENGARTTNNANEIAHYEFGSSLASDNVFEVIDNLKIGLSEMEVANGVSSYGQKTTIVSTIATGNRFQYANLYPSNKEIKLGDKISISTAYKGGLTCRVGYAVSNQEELSSEVSDYLDKLVYPYYHSYVCWLENVKIGMSGKEVYNLIESVLPKSEYNWTLNPGHLTADEEWLTSPIYPDSSEKLKSGMIMQVDIIPSLKGYAGVNCESGIVLADKKLRDEIEKEYPKLFEVFTKRRDYIVNELNISLSEDILLTNDTVAYYPMFLLNSSLVVCKQK